ncbi:MAG TPA: penicillin-binding transpeptidase domain-containing protein [Natronosporangium sp.]
MNAPLRRVGVIVMIMFGLLFANLNWVQAYKADEYRTNEYNCRTKIAEYERPRGIIAVGRDAQAAAVSTEVEDVVAQVCDTYLAVPYLREYPFGELYAHVIGYQSIELSTFGVERFETEFLAGTADALLVDRIRDMFSGGGSPGGNVLTTLSGPAQQTAYDELRDNGNGADRGAVVALDPRTGAVQAMVSMPSFDPEPLATPDREAAIDAYNELVENPDQPLYNRALRIDDIDQQTGQGGAFFPGSVMKVIVSAAALQAGLDPDTTIEGGAQYTAPTAGSPIGNAPGVNCPEEISLQQALTVSCNTAFARLAAEELGGDRLQEMAAAFGFGDDELRVGELGNGGLPVAASLLGELKRDDGQDDPPTVALSAIGQGSVQMSPLQGALIAATVANGGVQMHPYLVEELQDSQLRPVYQASPEQLRRPLSGEDANDLRDMMVSVVENGTGRNAQIPGYIVGGKTGTAESGSEEEIDHGWFVGFALDSDGTPITAVAVMLANAGAGGSAEAARIAGQVMQAVISDRGEG